MLFSTASDDSIAALQTAASGLPFRTEDNTLSMVASIIFHPVLSIALSCAASVSHVVSSSFAFVFAAEKSFAYHVCIFVKYFICFFVYFCTLIVDYIVQKSCF